MYPNGSRFAVQLSFDVEMVTNFPYWGSFWNHRKGAIDEPTKEYVRKISQTCAKYGAKAHFFLMGSLFEDPDVDYLKEALDAGHAVGNHTYTHVRITARDTSQLAGVYDFSPWLAAGRTGPEVVRQEIQMTTEAIRTRLGVEPKGFRSPGGFPNGMNDAPDVQKMLQEEGFWWISTHYDDTIQRQDFQVTRDIRRKMPLAQLKEAFNKSTSALQPYYYPSGLLEIPLSGITDVVAWRGYGPDLGEWLEMLVSGVDYAHEHGLIFMLTTHPAVLAAIDPECQTVDVVLRHALEKEGGVWLPDMEEIAERERELQQARKTS